MRGAELSATEQCHLTDHSSMLSFLVFMPSCWSRLRSDCRGHCTLWFVFSLSSLSIILIPSPIMPLDPDPDPDPDPNPGVSSLPCPLSSNYAATNIIRRQALFSPLSMFHFIPSEPSIEGLCYGLAEFPFELVPLWENDSESTMSALDPADPPSTLDVLNFTVHELSHLGPFHSIEELKRSISRTFGSTFGEWPFRQMQDNERNIDWTHPQANSHLSHLYTLMPRLWQRLESSRCCADVHQWSQEYPESTRDKMREWAYRFDAPFQAEQWQKIEEQYYALQVAKKKPTLDLRVAERGMERLITEILGCVSMTGSTDWESS